MRDLAIRRRRFRGKSGVGIQRNYVTDVARTAGGWPLLSMKVVSGAPPQQAIQLMQLPALAFPSHPRPFTFVPYRRRCST